MKLWILKAREELPEDDDPWEPWFDKVFRFVVRAETETEARKIANKCAMDENRGEKTPWLDPKYSTCVELTADGDAGLVIRDFASA